LEKIEMKKTLVALAALASVTAFAQTTVTLTGTMDGSFVNYNLKGNSVSSVIGSGGSATTAVIFSANEDLGAGSNAFFQYEIDPNLSETSNRTAGTSATGTGSNITSSAGNGQSFVGMSSASLGSIKFGTPNLLTLGASGDGNGGFATAIGSGYRITSFDAVRLQNSMKYESPVIQGFQVSINYSPKNALQTNATGVGLTGNLLNQSNGRDGATEIGLLYANGPLSMKYAALNMSQFAKVQMAADPDLSTTGATWTARPTGQSFKLNTLSVKYAVNSQLTANLFYQTIASDSLVAAVSAAETTAVYDRKTTGISASYAVTPVVTFMANFASAKNGAAASNSGNASSTTNVTGLGLDYNLSKTAVAFIRYERDSDSAGLRSVTGYTANGTTYTATAFGVRKTF